MRTNLILCLAILTVFAMAACGGGNDSNGSGKSDDKTKSAADLRKETITKMEAAFASLDGEALKAVWLPSEHALVDARITKEFTEMRGTGGSWTVKSSAIEEKDGKFTFTTEQEITPVKGGPSETETRPGEIVEHEGKWLLTFGKK